MSAYARSALLFKRGPQSERKILSGDQNSASKSPNHRCAHEAGHSSNEATNIVLQSNTADYCSTTHRPRVQRSNREANAGGTIETQSAGYHKVLPSGNGARLPPGNSFCTESRPPQNIDQPMNQSSQTDFGIDDHPGMSQLSMSQFSGTHGSTSTGTLSSPQIPSLHRSYLPQMSKTRSASYGNHTRRILPYHQRVNTKTQDDSQMPQTPSDQIHRYARTQQHAPFAMTPRMLPLGNARRQQQISSPKKGTEWQLMTPRRTYDRFSTGVNSCVTSAIRRARQTFRPYRPLDKKKSIPDQATDTAIGTTNTICTTHNSSNQTPKIIETALNTLQDRIGTDEGNRGMKERQRPLARNRFLSNQFTDNITIGTYGGNVGVALTSKHVAKNDSQPASSEDQKAESASTPIKKDVQITHQITMQELCDREEALKLRETEVMEQESVVSYKLEKIQNAMSALDSELVALDKAVQRSEEQVQKVIQRSEKQVGVMEEAFQRSEEQVGVMQKAVEDGVAKISNHREEQVWRQDKAATAIRSLLIKDLNSVKDSAVGTFSSSICSANRSLFGGSKKSSIQGLLTLETDPPNILDRRGKNINSHSKLSNISSSKRKSLADNSPEEAITDPALSELSPTKGTLNQTHSLSTLGNKTENKRRKCFSLLGRPVPMQASLITRSKMHENIRVTRSKAAASARHNVSIKKKDISRREFLLPSVIVASQRALAMFTPGRVKKRTFSTKIFQRKSKRTNRSSPTPGYIHSTNPRVTPCKTTSPSISTVDVLVTSRVLHTEHRFAAKVNKALLLSCSSTAVQEAMSGIDDNVACDSSLSSNMCTNDLKDSSGKVNADCKTIVSISPLVLKDIESKRKTDIRRKRTYVKRHTSLESMFQDPYGFLY